MSNGGESLINILKLLYINGSLLFYRESDACFQMVWSNIKILRQVPFHPWDNN